MAYRVVRPLAVHVLPLLVLGACSEFLTRVDAADYLQAEQLFFAGEYESCADVANGEVERGVWNEKWPALLIRCQLTLGLNEAAVETYEAALGRFLAIIYLLWVLYYHWFIARSALQVSTAAAAGIIFVEMAIDLTIQSITASLLG